MNKIAEKIQKKLLNHLWCFNPYSTEESTIEQRKNWHMLYCKRKMKNNLLIKCVKGKLSYYDELDNFLKNDFPLEIVTNRSKTFHAI